MGWFYQFIIQVREDILEEEDGPVLQHGLKGLHKSKLIYEGINRRDKSLSQFVKVLRTGAISTQRVQMPRQGFNPHR